MNVPQFLQAEDAKRVLSRVMTTHPDLAACGWDYPGLDRTTFVRERAKMNDPEVPLQVAAAYDFVAVTFLEDHVSYTLKHEAERWARNNGYLLRHISNGALIVAAIARGYTCTREKNGLDCTFKRFGKRDYTARRRSRKT